MTATQNPENCIVSAYDLAKEIEDFYCDGLPNGFSTGIGSLDKYYRPDKRYITIVTGVPQHGKSELVDEICVKMARNHDWRFLYFSPENYPIELHVSKLIRKVGGKPFGKGYTGAMSVNETAKAIDFIEGNFKFIRTDDTGFTLENILESAKYCIEINDLDGLVIDPWNSIDHQRPPNLREDEYISQALSKIISFARFNNIHIWLIAHPKKPDPGRNYKKTPPGLYDISGAAHWYNKADFGLTVFKPEVREGTEAHVIVTKVKFRNYGKPTPAEEPVVLDFDIASGRYYELK